MEVSIPVQSKVAVFQGPGKGFTIEHFPIPSLKSGELLVKISLCTVCGSDLHTFTGRRAGPAPGALGHEISGRLVAAGPDTRMLDYGDTPLVPGDFITWLLYTFDPDDPLSKMGYPQKSARMFKYGHEAITPEDALHSGFAEYIILRSGTPVFRIPDSLSVLLATPVNCTLATAMAAVRLSGGLKGKRVAVYGCGMMGYYSMAIARTFGAATVTAVDTNAERLLRARDFGSDTGYLFGQEGKETYDVVFEMSGSPQAMSKAVQVLRIGGIAVFAGAAFPQEDFALNGERIVRNLLTIRGIHNYLPEDLNASIAFLSGHYSNFPFEGLVEKTFPIDRINEAFEYALNQKPVRIAINPNE